MSSLQATLPMLWGVTERRRQSIINTTTLNHATNNTNPITYNNNTDNINQQQNENNNNNLTYPRRSNNSNTSSTSHQNTSRNSLTQTNQIRRRRRQNRRIQQISNLNNNAQIQQQHLTNNTELFQRSDDEWGDTFIEEKEDNIIRIGVRNINGLPHDFLHSKNLELISDIRKNHFDIFCMTETNIAWHAMPNEQRIHERFRGKFEFSRINHSYNRDKEFKERLQYGGTLSISQGNISGRVVQIGKDASTLGRWNWILLRGKDQLLVRIITVYRPVVSNGASSTYQQHSLHFNQRNINGCPRDVLLNDLKTEIDSWIAQGNRIIVHGDFNEDIRSIKIQSFFQQWGFKEIITERHGTNAPNTFQAGSTPIDGIFTSPDLTPIKCGYAPFSWGAKSDHRLLWAEFHIDSFFGCNLPPLWHPQARRLKMIDMNVVTKFIKERLSHAELNKLLQRIQDLSKGIQYNQLSNDEIIEIEALDKIRIEGILQADHKCRRIHAGEVPWSPDIQTSIDRLRYYRVCVSKFKNGQNIQSRTLHKLFQRADLETRVSNAEEATTLLNEEYQQYKLLKKEALSLRSSYLEEMAIRKAKYSSTTASNIFKTLVEQEKQREIGRKLRHLLGKPRLGVSHVEAPNSADEWVSMTTKEEIETACIQENIRRFTQANDTPPLLPEQVNLLGWTGDSNISDKILNGKSNSQLHPLINNLVPFLSMKEKIKERGPIPMTISTEEYLHGWRWCKEYTTSGKSGLHFGHFKSSCIDTTLTEIDRLFVEIALRTGYSLTRWHHGIDIMIPKKADSHRVDKLRTIVLMEADFNYINKIIGKRTMFNAETSNNLAAEQYGSRKQMSSILHATNKQLTFDILNSKKQNTALLVLDAKSCYDRIAQPIASICLRRQGAPKSFCSVMFDTIDKMEHTIRTSYGDSELKYQREDTRFHGILQGNGAGPAIWAVVSSPLLDRMNSTGYGVTITSPGSKTTMNIPAFAFVDDTDLIQHIPDTHDITHLPQKALTQWEENLIATGGALVSDKCSWFALAHKWKNGTWKYGSEQDSPGSVALQNNDGSRTTIQRCNPADAVPALGVMFSPSGNMKPQIDYMKQQATKWANTIRVCGLSRSHVWYSLNAMIMKSLEYPLLATTIAEKDLESIMSTILQVGLSKSGICRTIARTAVYASNKYFGFGIRHLHVTQGLTKLHLFLQPKSELTSHLITTAWECCRLQTGLGDNYFTIPITKNIRNYVSEGWMFTLWEFLHRYNVRLKRIPNETRRFKGDTFIMAHINKLTISKGDIRLFNYCRIYLQVELLSDILTADGKRIRPAIWKGERLIQCHRWQWPNQPRPDNKGWTTWRRILRCALATNTEGVLSIRQQNFCYSTEWKWFYSESELRLYEIQQGCIRYRSIFRQSGRQSRHRQLVFGGTSDCTMIPADLKICTVYPRGDQMVLESTGLSGQRDTETSLIPLWTSTIEQREEGEDSEFQAEWYTGHMMLVADGSAKDGRGTGAWIFTSLRLYNQGKYIEASAISPGPDSAQDSHRAECIGLLGGLRMVQQKLHSWRVESGHIVVACDNKSALQYAVLRDNYKYIHAHIPDYDVLQACRSVMEPGVDYEFHHVKGHQDEMGGPLDIYATLNVRMDLMAKRRRELYELEVTQRQYQHMRLPNEKWYLSANEHKLCRHLKTQIYEHISFQNVFQYWNKDDENGGRKVASVDWEGVKLAIKNLPTHRQHWISKHVFGDCGVNEILKRRKEKDTDLCKRCGEIETTAHVWHCKAPEVSRLWINSVENLKSFLADINTDPTIIMDISSNLLLWYTGDDTSEQHSACPLQDSIGWNYVIEGWISVE